MGCGSSKLQDIALQSEDFSYRRPVWNENRKRHVANLELGIDNGDTRKYDVCSQTTADRRIYKGTESLGSGVRSKEDVETRKPKTNQNEADLVTEQSDAIQKANDKIEELQNTMQRNIVKLVDLSHKTDIDNSKPDAHEQMIFGIKQNATETGIRDIDSDKTVNHTNKMNVTPIENKLFYNEAKIVHGDNAGNKVSDAQTVKQKKTRTDHDSLSEVNTTADVGGESETRTAVLKTADSSFNELKVPEGDEHYKKTAAELDSNEPQNNISPNKEIVSDTDRDENPKHSTNESKQNQKQKQEDENQNSDDRETQNEMEALTKEQSEAVCMLYYAKVVGLLDSVKDTEWIPDGGDIAEDICNLLDVLKCSYSVLYQVKALFSHIKEFREKIARLMLETRIADKICEVVVYACEKMPVSKYKKANNELHVPVHFAMHVFANYTDTSPELAEKIANYPGFLAVQRKIQKDFTDAQFQEPEPAPDESDCLCGTCIVSSSLCMIHNISMVESTIPLLRGHNFVEVLQPYLKSKNKEDHLTALATLAAIVDEKESEIINSNKKVVKYLMKTLKQGMRREERRFNGWSCKECGLTVRTLARNDANKRLLVQLGALKLLAKLSKGNTDEQIEAAGALWALSFDEENRKEMVENKKLRVIQRLSELKASDINKIKTAATGALWNLREDLRMSDDPTYQTLGKSFVTDVTDKAVLHKRLSKESLKDSSKEGQGHIFISYQWCNQRVLIDIRNELIKNGHKVWMDVDNMQGSTLQAMAEAVEDADMVLVCFSQKYKNSPNCRAGILTIEMASATSYLTLLRGKIDISILSEAEYTFQRQKPIIPLRMETNYKPDGWLGILVGTKLFYDFSGKYNFQDKLNKLLKDIVTLKRDMLSVTPKKIEPLYHSVDRVDGPIVQHVPETLKPATHSEASDVKNWIADDVRNWIRKHNLPEEECANFTCDEICLLLKMMNEAPESFYKGLQRKFNYDFKIISQLVKALEEISN